MVKWWIWFWGIGFWGIGCLAGSSVFAQTEVRCLTTGEFLNLMMYSEGEIVVDVRAEKSDYRAGHVAGSRYAADFEVLMELLDDRTVDQPILLYSSDTEIRSREAAELLLEHGFNDVYILSGGIEAWKNAAFPTETGRR